MEKFLLVIILGIVLLSGYWLYSGQQEMTGTHTLISLPKEIEIVHQGYKSRYEHKGIPIEFSENSIKYKEKKDIEDIKAALTLIKDKSPEDYRMVETYVDEITIIIVVMYGGTGGQYTRGTKDIDVMLQIINPKCVNCDLTSEDYERLAGVIVHEACHSMRYNTGVGSALGLDENISREAIEEEACIGMGNDFLERIRSEHRQEPYSAEE